MPLRRRRPRLIVANTGHELLEVAEIHGGAHKQCLKPDTQERMPLRPALPVKLLRWFPFLRRLPARLLGLGFRPEHIHTPDAFAQKS